MKFYEIKKFMSLFSCFSKFQAQLNYLKTFVRGEITNLFLNNVTFLKLNKNEVITAVEN